VPSSSRVTEMVWENAPGVDEALSMLHGLHRVRKPLNFIGGRCGFLKTATPRGVFPELRNLSHFLTQFPSRDFSMAFAARDML
jgi:hypothetical protein